MTNPIGTGAHSVMINCPECGQTALVPLNLAGYLQVDEQAAQIRLRTHSKPVPHTCDNGNNGATLFDDDQGDE